MSSHLIIRILGLNLGLSVFEAVCLFLLYREAVWVKRREATLIVRQEEFGWWPLLGRCRGGFHKVCLVNSPT